MTATCGWRKIADWGQPPDWVTERDQGHIVLLRDEDHPDPWIYRLGGNECSVLLGDSIEWCVIDAPTVVDPKLRAVMRVEMFGLKFERWATDPDSGISHGHPDEYIRVYELSDAQWVRIGELPVNEPSGGGQSFCAQVNRLLGSDYL